MNSEIVKRSFAKFVAEASSGEDVSIDVGAPGTVVLTTTTPEAPTTAIPQSLALADWSNVMTAAAVLGISFSITKRGVVICHLVRNTERRHPALKYKSTDEVAS